MFKNVAIQSIGRPDEGYVAYWSESHVSEDFDVSLRLQIAGNIIRLASYHGEEFKEGVSLTIYDELARWEKYVRPRVRAMALLCQLIILES
jgi:hypothetical protein